MNTFKFDEFTKSMWMNSPQQMKEQVSIAALGLTGESGEVAEKIKKYIRGDYDLFDGSVESLGKIEAILYELGDVAFYISRMASFFGSDLDDVLTKNYAKLTARKARRGDLRGDGDSR